MYIELKLMFVYMIDERFLIKQISKYEMDAFLGSANKYFVYMFDQVFDKGVRRFIQRNKR
jgi:hypothetical protein